MSSIRQQQVSWQIKAACRGPQAVYFYPPMQGEKREQKAIREKTAKAICSTCAVKKQCLDYALANHEIHGIWGGLTEAERRQIFETSEDNLIKFNLD